MLVKNKLSFFTYFYTLKILKNTVYIINLFVNLYSDYNIKQQ